MDRVTDRSKDHHPYTLLGFDEEIVYGLNFMVRLVPKFRNREPGIVYFNIERARNPQVYRSVAVMLSVGMVRILWHSMVLTTCLRHQSAAPFL